MGYEKELSDDEEIKLIKKIQEGDMESCEKLLSFHLKHIDEFSNKFLGCGLSKDNLMQKGTVGFIIAISKFKTDKDFHFLPYADFWMQRIIHDSIYIYKPDYNISITKYNGIMPRISSDSKSIMVSESDDGNGECLIDIIGEKFFITDAELKQMDIEARIKDEIERLEDIIINTLNSERDVFSDQQYGRPSDKHYDYLRKSFINVVKAIDTTRDNRRLDKIKKMEKLQKEKEEEISHCIWSNNF